MCAGAKLDSTTNGTRPDKPEHTRQECLPTYAADRLKQARHTENKLDCEILRATVLRKRLNLQGTRLPGLSRSILHFLPSAAGEAGSGRARCRVQCTISLADETLKGVLASATAHCPAQGYPAAQTDGKVDRGVSAVFVSFLRQCPATTHLTDPMRASTASDTLSRHPAQVSHSSYEICPRMCLYCKGVVDWICLGPGFFKTQGQPQEFEERKCTGTTFEVHLCLLGCNLFAALTSDAAGLRF